MHVGVEHFYYPVFRVNFTQFILYVSYIEAFILGLKLIINIQDIGGNLIQTIIDRFSLVRRSRHSFFHGIPCSFFGKYFCGYFCPFAFIGKSGINWANIILFFLRSLE